MSQNAEATRGQVEEEIFALPSANLLLFSFSPRINGENVREPARGT
jgi:hypothetical protein